MNRIDRLFALHTFLQSRKHTMASDIAMHFNISMRTVYRDIRALGECGVPVSFEPVKGYFMVQGYFLPPISFTTEEAAALMLMEGATRVFADKSIQHLYGTALNKIRSVLRSSQKDGIEALSSSTGIQLPSCMEADYDYLATLQTAIGQKCILEIVYTAKNEEQSSRRIEPVGLMFYAMSWHLMAWCHKRMAYRDFRVSRINEIRNTGEPFLKQDHLSLEELRRELPVDY